MLALLCVGGLRNSVGRTGGSSQMYCRTGHTLPKVLFLCIRRPQQDVPSGMIRSKPLHIPGVELKIHANCRVTISYLIFAAHHLHANTVSALMTSFTQCRNTMHVPPEPNTKTNGRKHVGGNKRPPSCANFARHSPHLQRRKSR